MIVKDAARDLPECLASVRGVVDEIVVADTGSSDSTIEIARVAGARVVSIPWEDDFASARNRSLAEVKADWVLTMDADEQLDPSARSEIPGLLEQTRHDAFQVTIRNYVSDLAQKIWDRPAVHNDGSYPPGAKYPAYIEHENVRLFRRDSEIYFTGRVHESVGWRIRETGGKIGTARFRIHHFGIVRESPESKARKLEFYRRLGRLKVGDQPENAQAHLELGLVELENGGTVEEALPCFERACELNPRLGVAWYFAGASAFHLGNWSRALEAMRHAEQSGHATAAVAELAGDANYNLKNYEAARAWFRKAEKRSPGSASIGSKLGLAEARTGDSAAGVRRLRQAIEMEPANPSLYDRLIVVEVWLDHLREAAATAEKKLEGTQGRPEDFLRAAAIWRQIREWKRAEDTLQRGLVKFPESEPLRQALHRIETEKDAQPTEVTAKPIG